MSDVRDERSNIVVSVVIPVYLEASQLCEVLQSLTRQTFPLSDLEVLVADSGSSDGTDRVCQDYSDRLPVTYLPNVGRGRSRALNAAIREANGQYICRIDARSRIPENYIERLLSVAQETGAAVVGGIQRAEATADSLWARAIAFAINSPMGAGPAHFRTGARFGPTDTVYLGLYRADVFSKVGYFHETDAAFSEESDLHQRISDDGGTIWLDAETIVGYRPRSDLLGQASIYHHYGKAKAQVIKKHLRALKLRQYPPIVLVAFVFVGGAASIFQPLFSWFYLVALGGYVTLIFSYFLSFEKTRAPIHVRLVSALVSIIMHLSWGAGFWRCLIIRR